MPKWVGCRELGRQLLTLPLKALVILAVILPVGMVLLQDFMIFPQLIGDVWSWSPRNANTLPPSVETITLRMNDGTEVEVWRHEVLPGVPRSKDVAVIFHGNAGLIDRFHRYMVWFADRGVTS